MHSSAFRIGKKFLAYYWDKGMTDILEIGSMDVNGSLRAGAPPEANYVGVNIEPGPGVDIVVDKGQKLPFKDGSFDLVLASSVFEHDPFWWRTLEEMFRVCKSNGYIYVSAPSNGKLHRHPLDLFRFYPDAGISMVEIGKGSHAPSARLIESFVAEQDQGEIWNDFVCVLAKGPAVGGGPSSLIYPTEKSLNVWQDNSFLHSTFSEVPEDGRKSEALIESQARNKHLSEELTKIYNSFSWRLTSPLRSLWRFKRVKMGSQNSREQGTGIVSIKWSDLQQGLDLFRLRVVDAKFCHGKSRNSLTNTIRLVKSWREEEVARRPIPGFNPIIYREHFRLPLSVDPTLHFAKSKLPSGPWQTQIFTPIGQSKRVSETGSPKTAVHIHVYFIDVFEEILTAILGNQNVPDLLITFPDISMANAIEAKTRHYQGLVTLVPLGINRGRDLGAFFFGIGGEKLSGYDVVFHVHTKKSLENKDGGPNEKDYGGKWRRFLIANLLGSSSGPRMLDEVIDRFETNQNLGVVFPADPNILGWGGYPNQTLAKQLFFAEQHLPGPDETFDFPVGSFFAARPEALTKFFNLGLNLENLPAEPLPANGTVLHALERLIGVVPTLQGFEAAAVYSPGTSR